MKEHRWPRGSAPRKPLRAFRELADEFGITMEQLGGLMSRHDGPKPRLRNTDSWYDPAEMRAWWKGIKRD